MAHFAKVVNNIVEQVIVAEQDFIDSGAVGNPFRKNFAGVGFTYNIEKDAFIPPKPLQYESWVLNEEKCIWEAPIEMPSDGKPYYWDEELLEWVLLDESLIIP